ncbi:hypothetical protein KIL84_016034 [Mauremys mutica]|uniref:Uncharacterized protein n=1 Tax=Mauremys mutica TaxID=74926 RepID=A0A9D3WTI6_9SAUR|nr:hypothetical protein KIL84_016034 [Mauremys mutica]
MLLSSPTCISMVCISKATNSDGHQFVMLHLPSQGSGCGACPCQGPSVHTASSALVTPRQEQQALPVQHHRVRPFLGCGTRLPVGGDNSPSPYLNPAQAHPLLSSVNAHSLGSVQQSLY